LTKPNCHWRSDISTKPGSHAVAPGKSSKLSDIRTAS